MACDRVRHVRNREKPLSRYAVPALAVVCLLGGCSGEPPGEQSGKDDSAQVASLSSGQPQTSTSNSIDDRRPLGASSDEYFALLRDWEACVRKEGGSAYEKNPKLVFEKRQKKDPKGAAVWDACYVKFPERFDERLKRKDLTAFKDNQREFYACVKSAGYKLTAPDPDDGSFGLTEIGPNGDAQSPTFLACEREAFAD